MGDRREADFSVYFADAPGYATYVVLNCLSSPNDQDFMLFDTSHDGYLAFNGDLT
jgi:hypothetical protein